MSVDALPLETLEALAKAWLDYNDLVGQIFEKLDDETLLKYGGEITPEDHDKVFDWRDLTQRTAAILVVSMRRHMERAKPVLETGGVYCVYHGKDMRECGPLHTDSGGD
jgi:hypothetical protein